MNAFCVAFVSLLFACGASQADVLLDRLGPTNQGTSSGRSQLEVSGLPTVIGTQKMVAVPLVVTGTDYFLTSVDSAFSRGNTSNPEVSFELWGANPATGNPDRNQIIEISPTRLVVPLGTGVVTGTFTFSGTSRLTAGVTYWIVARKQSGPGSVFMTENLIGDTSPWVFTSNGFLNGVASTGPTIFPGPALRVHGTPACDLALTQQPASAAACPNGSAMFSVAAAGTGPFMYQWQVQTAPGVWQTMGNDPGPLPCGGGAFSYAAPINSPSVSIGIRPCPGDPTQPQRFQVRALVTSGCGGLTSSEATYTICPADFNCSGGVSVQDIFDFLAAYFAGQPSADFNGSGTISVQDIFDFLGAYFAGCA